MELREYTLDELLSYEQPSKYIVESTDYDDSYDIPVLTAGKSFVLGYTNESTGVFEDLPVIIFDDFTTATKYVDFKFKVKSSAMKILHINKELVLPKYIYYRMQVIQIDHSTHKRYWIQKYSQIKVKIPIIDEQRKIVDKIEELLSELDKAVDILNKSKEQLEIYRKAVLKEAFANDYLWDEFEFGKLMSIVRNGYGVKPDDSGSHKILTIGAVRAMSIDLDNCRYNETGFEYDDLIRENDLLFTRYNGSKEFVGVCARVPKIEDEYAYPDKLIKFRPIIQDTDYSKFLVYYVSQGKAREYLRTKIKTTSGQNGISGSDIKKMRIHVPDMDTIREIVRYIENRLLICNNIEKTIDLSMLQAEAMRQSILKEAFEGRFV